MLSKGPGCAVQGRWQDRAWSALCLPVRLACIQASKQAHFGVFLQWVGTTSGPFLENNLENPNLIFFLVSLSSAGCYASGDLSPQLTHSNAASHLLLPECACTLGDRPSDESRLHENPNLAIFFFRYNPHPP